MENNLLVLSEAGGFIQQFQQLQRQLKQIQDVLHSSQPVIINSPHDSDVTPRNSPPSDASRTAGSSWVDEMNHCDPPGEDDSSSSADTKSRAPRKVAKVSERTEQHLVRSFACLGNDDHLTKSPKLDKIMAAQCSKCTRSNDQALARIQALNSDVLGPHDRTDGDAEQT